MREWDAWLREQERSGKGGVVLAAASRGRKYTLPVILPDAFAEAALAGRVRAAPDAGGGALATFSVAAAVVADGKATFVCTLSAGSTAGLPADGDMDGLVHFPVEFELTPDGGDAELLVAALLPVTGRI